MTLAEYLRANNLKAGEFAALIGRDPSLVRRWASGNFHPDRRGRQDIFRATGGAVTPGELVTEPEAAE
jgi:DNA-binding transcriptional regulator YdaS (Cro superfamily)